MGVMNGDEIRDRILAGVVMLVVVLAVLRLTGVADLPWLWVFSPIWITIGMMFLGSGLALIWVLVRPLFGVKSE